jgi:hypothetical protein
MYFDTWRSEIITCRGHVHYTEREKPKSKLSSLNRPPHCLYSRPSHRQLPLEECHTRYSTEGLIASFTKHRIGRIEWISAQGKRSLISCVVMPGGTKGIANSYKEVRVEDARGTFGSLYSNRAPDHSAWNDVCSWRYRR